jgi:hypothetical protein
MENTPPGIFLNTAPVDGKGRRIYRSRMGGRHLNILLSFFVMTVPMIAFSALILGLVYRYRVVHNDFIQENLRFDRGQDESDVIYVKLSATILTTIASWSSTVAPILVGFVVTLISYPVARTLVNAVEYNRSDQLLTPYQLALMLRMVASGGPASFWDWVKYAAGWKGRRQPQPRALKVMSSMLFLGITLRYVSSDTFSFVRSCLMHCF